MMIMIMVHPAHDDVGAHHQPVHTIVIITAIFIASLGCLQVCCCTAALECGSPAAWVALCRNPSEAGIPSVQLWSSEDAMLTDGSPFQFTVERNLASESPEGHCRRDVARCCSLADSVLRSIFVKVPVRAPPSLSGSRQPQHSVWRRDLHGIAGALCTVAEQEPDIQH